jgi:hypothetical protein
VVDFVSGGKGQKVDILGKLVNDGLALSLELDWIAVGRLVACDCASGTIAGESNNNVNTCPFQCTPNRDNKFEDMRRILLGVDASRRKGEERSCQKNRFTIESSRSKRT